MCTYLQTLISEIDSYDRREQTIKKHTVMWLKSGMQYLRCTRINYLIKTVNVIGIKSKIFAKHLNLF